MLPEPLNTPSDPQQQAPQIGHTSSVRKDPAAEDISFDFDSLQNSNLDLSDVKVCGGGGGIALLVLFAYSTERVSGTLKWHRNILAISSNM